MIAREPMHGSGARPYFMSLVVALGFLGACSSPLPPKDLVQARATYDRASKGPAAQLAPAELDTAKQSLMRAESSFQGEGDDPSTRDLAYIAERRALAAEARAAIIQAERDREAAEKAFKQAQFATLDSTKAQLEAARDAKAQASAQVEKTQAMLEAERRAREEAEKRAAAALQSLNEIAKVKEESRGVVITLSGQVLFATGKYDLLPIARQKLDEVAKALKDQGVRSLIVEGHTDSRGNAQANEELSLRRAEAVRNHLVGTGIPPEKVRAVGLGSTRPVADNGTPEGRANNRRVEIVVEPER